MDPAIAPCKHHPNLGTAEMICVNLVLNSMMWKYVVAVILAVLLLYMTNLPGDHQSTQRRRKDFLIGGHSLKLHIE